MRTTTDHVEMMKTPSRWPQWPALPVKHKTKRSLGTFPDVGIMFATGKPRVYDVGLYDLGESTNLDDVKHWDYPSFEALAEEWEVD